MRMPVFWKHSIREKPRMALELTDAQLILIFLGFLIGTAVIVIIYMLFKGRKEDLEKRKQARRRARRKPKKIKHIPEPGKEDEDESYVVTLYDLLGVSNKATPEEIKRAYRQKCKNMHPDVTGMDDRSFISSLNVAKHTLLDPKERKRYDQFLDKREVSWIHEMAGEVEGTDHRIKVTGSAIPRLAPGESVCKKANEDMEWDE